MAVTVEPGWIDGYRSVQAVRRRSSPSRKDAGAPRPPRDRTPDARGTRPPSRPAGPDQPRIGRTALPARHELVCYDCGYAFILPGRMRDTVCPRCHVTLRHSDVTIEGEWSGIVKTIGAVTIRRGARIAESRIVGMNVIVDDDVSRASIEVCGCLVFEPNARFDLARLRFRDARIAAGAKPAWPGAFECRNLDVAGELEARIRASGLVTIRRGGWLRGSLRSARLCVEDGGGLSAEVEVGT